MICSVYPNIPDLFWITINTHRSYFPSSKIYTQKASNSVILTFGCKFAGYIFTSDNIFHQLKVSSLAQNFITFNRSIFQLQDDLTYKEKYYLLGQDKMCSTARLLCETLAQL